MARAGIAPPCALLLSLGVGCGDDILARRNGDEPSPVKPPDTPVVQPPGPTAQALPGWQWENPLPQGNNLRSIVGIAGNTPAEDELYMVGDSGTLMHRTTSGWRKEGGAVTDARALLGVAVSGEGMSRRLLSVGVYDIALSRDASEWSAAPAPQSGAGSLTAVWGSQVPGEYYVTGTTGRIYHVRGEIWQQEARGLATHYLAGVWGTGAGPSQEVYAVGASGRVLHKKDGVWAIEAEGLTTQQLNAVFGLGPDIYAVGDGGTVLHRKDGAWQVEKTPTMVSLNGVWGAGDEVFAVGEKGTVLRRSTSGWRAEATGLTAEMLSGIWGTVRRGQVTVYAVGNLGTVLRREQATWSALSSRLTQVPLTSVWARTSDEVYAVGAQGTILRRRGNQQKGVWSLEGEGVTAEGLNAVSGWAPNQDAVEAEVYAVGTTGTILHRIGGSWVIEGAVLTGQDLTAVWVGADAVFVVGRNGRIAVRRDGRWRLEQAPVGLPALDLLSVWGSGQGAQLVVYAAGASGVILRRNPEGVWTREGEGATDQSIGSLFGRGPDEVYALGTGGVALRRLSGKWVPEAMNLRGRTAIAGCVVPGNNNLYAVATTGVILKKASGGTWARESEGLTTQELTSISAAAMDDVYIVGAGGIILHRK